MNSFEWANPTSVAEAVQMLAVDKSVDPDEVPRPMGGGQDLLTTMKSYVTRPPRVVNLKTIGALEGVTFDPSGRVEIGALTTIDWFANSSKMDAIAPGLVEAAHSIATPQIRNVGTVGGNLCQRPRCWYFRLENVICLKKGGSTCYAKDGENKYHAILGGGPSYIVHPSDLAPMLMALDASVMVAGAGPDREVPLSELYVLPRDGGIRKETSLKDGDIITKVIVPATTFARRSTYLKFKERASLDFAMASVAAAVELDADSTVRQARIVLGGVAPIPWRVPKAEAAIIGKKLDPAAVNAVAEIALEGAVPLAKNGYKVPLTQTLVRRALLKCAAMA